MNTTATINISINKKLEALRSRIQQNRRHAEAQWLVHEYRQCLGLTPA